MIYFIDLTIMRTLPRIVKMRKNNSFGGSDFVIKRKQLRAMAPITLHSTERSSPRACAAKKPRYVEWNQEGRKTD
jgi:hypothetical protein